jgi:transcriptional regulator with XRE-family HTH domain
MLIGKKIKEFRKKQNMSLSDLARKSGVQIATLSRIENQKMIGTLQSHQDIARALGIDVTELYRSGPYIRETSAVAPSPSPSETFTYNKAASYELLTSQVLSKKMMPVLLRIEPKGQTNPEQNQAGGERFIFVLEGQIIAHVGAKTYTLTPSNTLYLDAAQKHYFENTGISVARAISVLTPVTL